LLPQLQSPVARALDNTQTTKPPFHEPPHTPPPYSNQPSNPQPHCQVYPVTYQNLNYASVAVGITLFISVAWWVVDAKNWFKGPRFGYGEDSVDASKRVAAEAAEDGDKANKDIDVGAS